MPDYSFCEEIFPNIKSKPPLTQLEAFASHPVTSYLEGKTNTCGSSSASSSPDYTTPFPSGAVQCQHVVQVPS